MGPYDLCMEGPPIRISLNQNEFPGYLGKRHLCQYILFILKVNKRSIRRLRALFKVQSNCSYPGHQVITFDKN